MERQEGWIQEEGQPHCQTISRNAVRDQPVTDWNHEGDRLRVSNTCFRESIYGVATGSIWHILDNGWCWFSVVWWSFDPRKDLVMFLRWLCQFVMHSNVFLMLDDTRYCYKHLYFLKRFRCYCFQIFLWIEFSFLKFHTELDWPHIV